MLTKVFLDFETYYDSKYNLKNKDLSMTEYVQALTFDKVHCLGIFIENYDKEPRYYLNKNDIKHVIDDISWNEIALVCHHTQFDGYILNYLYEVKPAYYYCTLSMARAHFGNTIRHSLDDVALYYGFESKLYENLEKVKGLKVIPEPLAEDLGEYCARDVLLTYKIFKEMIGDFHTNELDLIDHTVRMYTEPMLQVDLPLALEIYENEIKGKKDTLAKLNLSQIDLTSRNRFANLLKELDVDPPKKISPVTGKETYAFAKADLEFQKLEVHENEKVQELVKARKQIQSSIEETRASRLISHATPINKLPIYLAYAKAHTTRWAGGDKMNPQNFKRDTRLRNAIIAPKKHSLIIVDSAQIEVRVLAWLAGEIKLLKAFAEERDIYSEFASLIYKRPIDRKKESDKKEGFVGKTCILGLGYTMGFRKLKYMLEAGLAGPMIEISEAECIKAVNLYRSHYKKISSLWNVMDNMIHNMISGQRTSYKDVLLFDKHVIHIPNRLKLHYPELRAESTYNGFNYKFNLNTFIHGGFLTENIVQALSRIIVANQILRVAHKYRIVLMAHDEVVLCVPTDIANDALNETVEAFNTPPDAWNKDIPLKGEGVISACYMK